MSQLELRLLTSLAVYHRRVLKNCDLKHAFIQPSLPEHEEYFLRPPPGCPRSKPGQYLKLLRLLYGLKGAPKLWFEMLSSHLTAMGLKNSDHSPCLFTGVLVPSEPLIFVGIYVDDIIYFSAADTVEKKFEECVSTIGTVDFMGQVSLFLGTEFTRLHHDDGHVTVSLTQQSFAETLLESLGIDISGQSSVTTPYCAGQSIDSIPNVSMSSSDHNILRLKYQTLVGSLNWLAHTTRPDLATVVSLLAQHQSDPSPGHYDAACYVAKYIATTKTLGIYFTSRKHSIIESFLHFPIPSNILSMSDANWGPQDSLISNTTMELLLFASRSMLASTLTYWVLSIGFQNARKLLLSALWKRKFTPLMRVSNFYLSYHRYMISLMFVIFLCHLLISYIMITRLVCSGQNKLPPRAFDTFR